MVLCVRLLTVCTLNQSWLTTRDSVLCCTSKQWYIYYVPEEVQRPEWPCRLMPKGLRTETRRAEAEVGYCGGVAAPTDGFFSILYRVIASPGKSLNRFQKVLLQYILRDHGIVTVNT